MSLYIVTRGSDKERLRPLVRLMLTMITRTLMGVPLRFRQGQPVMPHRHRLLMMLDEFPSLDRMHAIEDALPKCAGYGIKASSAAQDREQMLAPYGEHQTITANCHIRIIYAPNERETARWMSDMIGTTTIVKEDVTESGTRIGSLNQVSRTYHEVSRPLMTPDEIMTLRKPRKERQRRAEVIAKRARWWFSSRVRARSRERKSSTSSIRYSAGARRSRLPPQARRCGGPQVSGHDPHARSPLGAVFVDSLAGANDRVADKRPASMPRGLWRVTPVVAPLRRGQIVTICPPDTPRSARRRRAATSRPGDARAATEPLVKPIGAAPATLWQCPRPE